MQTNLPKADNHCFNIIAEELQKQTELMEQLVRINAESGQAVDELTNLCVDEYGKVASQLSCRIERLEKMIEKVPEFYDYWKGLNCCGYQD